MVEKWWRKRETEERKEGEMEGGGDRGERKEEKWRRVVEGEGTEERMTDERRREGARERF